MPPSLSITSYKYMLLFIWANQKPNILCCDEKFTLAPPNHVRRTYNVAMLSYKMRPVGNGNSWENPHRPARFTRYSQTTIYYVQYPPRRIYMRFLGMTTLTFRITSAAEMPGYGVDPSVTISHIKMPKLQMSDFTEKMSSYSDSIAIHLLIRCEKKRM